jgi:hypothetical protein
MTPIKNYLSKILTHQREKIKSYFYVEQHINCNISRILKIDTRLNRVEIFSSISNMIVYTKQPFHTRKTNENIDYFKNR